MSEGPKPSSSASRVLRDRLRDELEDFTRHDRELTAAINAAFHRDSATPIATPDALSLSEPPMTQEELRAIAERTRPALKQLGATAKMHRAAADLAEYEAAAQGGRSDFNPGSLPGIDVESIVLLR